MSSSIVPSASASRSKRFPKSKLASFNHVESCKNCCSSVSAHEKDARALSVDYRSVPSIRSYRLRILLPRFLPCASLPLSYSSTGYNMTQYSLGPPASFELAVLHRSVPSPLSSPEFVLPQFDWGSSSSQRSSSISLRSPSVSPTGSFDDYWELELKSTSFDHGEEKAAGEFVYSDIEGNATEWLPDSSNPQRQKAERASPRNRSLRNLTDDFWLDRPSRESHHSSHDSLCF